MSDPLTNPEIRKLKALAQRLEPVLRIGKSGLSDAFLASLEQALNTHELVKIKFTEFKEEKKRLAPVLAEKTSSLLVQRVGNVVVLFRRQRDPARRVVQL